jgi:hypothetical protein
MKGWRSGTEGGNGQGPRALVVAALSTILGYATVQFPSVVVTGDGRREQRRWDVEAWKESRKSPTAWLESTNRK